MENWKTDGRSENERRSNVLQSETNDIHNTIKNNQYISTLNSNKSNNDVDVDTVNVSVHQTLNITTPPLPEYKIISFGYRCSVAGILKKLGLKHESFPFDWLVSRLSVIKHCIEDDFQEFLKLENYQERYACTFGHMNTTDRYVCDEHMLVNMFYQPFYNTNPTNAYQYHLAMNHHNIMEKPSDYEYYKRCVERFRNEFTAKTSKMFVHVTPLYTLENYQLLANDIKKDCQGFQVFLENKIENLHSSEGIVGEYLNFTIRSLYFIMVLDNLENEPIITLLEEDVEHPKYKHKIYLLKTNYNFIDAGETFLGDYKREQELIENSIRRFSI